MLHSLPFIDRDEGEAAAAAVYRQAERLVNSLGGQAFSEHGFRVWMGLGFKAPKFQV